MISAICLFLVPAPASFFFFEHLKQKENIKTVPLVVVHKSQQVIADSTDTVSLTLWLIKPKAMAGSVLKRNSLKKIASIESKRWDYCFKMKTIKD